MLREMGRVERCVGIVPLSHTMSLNLKTKVGSACSLIAQILFLRTTVRKPTYLGRQKCCIYISHFFTQNSKKM